MKSFFQFLNEATQSQASLQAKKLNLKSDGHGGWYDSRGEFVAKTEAGKLKFYDKGERVGQKDVPNPAQPKAKPTEKPAAKPQASTATQKKVSGTPEGEGGTGEISDALTVAFGRFNPPTIS